MAKPQTHIDLFLTRRIRLRREHLAGQTVEANEDPMLIGERGKRFSVQTLTAMQLLDDGSAEKYDRAKHETYLAELEAEKKHQEKQDKKQLQPA